MMIHAETLKLSGLRHAFFTRAGGVSAGVYSSLNGGVGSRDHAGHVAENRARMAASPLCDGPRFARALEAAFQGMWRRWTSDRPPEGFDVTDHA